MNVFKITLGFFFVRGVKRNVIQKEERKGL
jgi:hypothetical protein